jgi:hypothetical protein
MDDDNLKVTTSTQRYEVICYNGGLEFGDDEVMDRKGFEKVCKRAGWDLRRMRGWDSDDEDEVDVEELFGIEQDSEDDEEDEEDDDGEEDDENHVGNLLEFFLAGGEVLDDDEEDESFVGSVDGSAAEDADGPHQDAGSIEEIEPDDDADAEA